jgi:glycosyltransferase involved in cell wall biosynthesis
MTAPFSRTPRGRPLRICIVSNAAVSQNPRVVKEADALCAEGCDVTVVFAQDASWTVENDRRIVARARWRGIAIAAWPEGMGQRMKVFRLRARVALFRVLAKISTAAPIAELAYSRYLREQIRAATAVQADLYIGHNPASLPVVALAARYTGAKYGFDFEDFYAGELLAGQRPSPLERLRTVLEARHLQGASYYTAASWGIAEEARKAHGIRTPATVLNVFPWRDRALLPESTSAGLHGPLSLYWFSQIVGLDRGLQDAICALGRVRSPVVLHIRGRAAPAVTAELLSLAGEVGSNSKIIFHEPVAAEDVLVSCLEHDIGLCLEVPRSVNRDVCITNKIFVYMLAGLTVIASRTRGQKEVLAATPDAGFLYEPGDVDALAAIIERLAYDRALLASTRRAALEAARTRWNWELESRALVAAIDTALNMPVPGIV